MLPRAKSGFSKNEFSNLFQSLPDKSEIADIKNLGGREAGSISAAKFLQEFVGDVPWAHLDIAGTAYEQKHVPYLGKGASGVGVRLLVALLGMLKNNPKSKI